MSTNWKLIGKNSGNMSQYRNVTHNKLNYETGKLNSIYDVSGIPTKGYTFDICGENIVLGVGTDKPFSRLSLGNNTDSGKFNANKPGQLSAIALDESGTGNSFTGIVLNSDITTLDGNPTKGIQIMSSTSDFSMNDTTNTGKIILSNENVTTIGGNSRGKPFGYSPNSTRDIVLDVRGSIRTDGYINFYNVVSTSVPITTVPAGSEWTTTNTGDVPRGSLFLTSGGGGTEGLWFKNKAGDLKQITGTGGGGGVGTGSSFDICGTGTDSFIVAKNTTSGYGGTPVTFSGKTWAPTVINNNNAVTIRDGNLAVITPSGDYLKVISPTDISAVSHFTDYSGGIILAQKQLLIGGITNSTSQERFGYGLIDVQSVEKVPTLQGYNNPSTTSFRPTAATNSIILLSKETGHNGHSNGVSEIGNIYDCSNTIIIGGSNFSQIDTPNSIISINPDLETNKTKIIDISGSNLVFGANNDLSGSPFSIIFGTDNKIDNTEKAGLEGKENVVLGSTNNLYNSQNSLVQGTGNINYGNLNVIFGKDNKIGNNLDGPAYYHYSGSNCFIQGSENEIEAYYDASVNNAFIAGYKNILDCSYALFSQNPNSSYILLGSSASINEDISNVRLAFGTKEMTGNVFTIDMSGKVEISGNLLVKGERTVTNNIFANNIIANDISANDISCVDISAVNGYFTGDLSCNGKLTVGGLIDPTGLVLDNPASVPADIPSSSDKATIYFKGGAPFYDIQGVETAFTSGGSGASVGKADWAVKIQQIGDDTTNGEQCIAFTAATTTTVENDLSHNVYGSTKLSYNPNTEILTATFFNGTLSAGGFANLTKQDIPPDLSGNCATADLVNSFSNLTKQDIPPDLSGNCATTNKIQSEGTNGIVKTIGGNGTLEADKPSAGNKFVKCDLVGAVTFVDALSSNTITVQDLPPDTDDNGMSAGDIIVDKTGNNVYFKKDGSGATWVKLTGATFTAGPP